jgi:hypothetical protein
VPDPKDGTKELRQLALIRGASAALEATDILAAATQTRLAAIDGQARVLLDEGRLTGEAAIALWAERSAILRLFAELEGSVERGRRAMSARFAPPGA